jgi:hypothetical protein
MTLFPGVKFYKPESAEPTINGIGFSRGDTAPKKVVDFKGETNDIYAILTKPAQEGFRSNVAQSKFTVYNSQKSLQGLKLNPANDTVQQWKQETLDQGIQLETKEQKPKFAAE